MSTPETEFSFERAMKRVDSYPFIRKYLPVDRYLIRPAASLVVRALFKTDVTPNQVTKASFVFGLLAAIVFAGGKHGLFALAGGLVLVSTILDAADGMLARAKGLTSRYGAYLDLILDRIADFAVLAGATYGFFKHTSSAAFLAFGLLTIGLYFLHLAILYLSMLHVRTEKTGEGAEAKSLSSFLIFLFSIAGRPNLILIGVFLLAVIGMIVNLVRFLSKERDPDPA